MFQQPFIATIQDWEIVKAYPKLPKAGGLIHSKEEAQAALKAGASAVSASSPLVWS